MHIKRDPKRHPISLAELHFALGSVGWTGGATATVSSRASSRAAVSQTAFSCTRSSLVVWRGSQEAPMTSCAQCATGTSTICSSTHSKLRSLDSAVRCCSTHLAPLCFPRPDPSDVPGRPASSRCPRSAGESLPLSSLALSLAAQPTQLQPFQTSVQRGSNHIESGDSSLTTDIAEDIQTAREPAWLV